MSKGYIIDGPDDEIAGIVVRHKGERGIRFHSASKAYAALDSHVFVAPAAAQRAAREFVRTRASRARATTLPRFFRGAVMRIASAAGLNGLVFRSKDQDVSAADARRMRGRVCRRRAITACWTGNAAARADAAFDAGTGTLDVIVPARGGSLHRSAAGSGESLHQPGV